MASNFRPLVPLLFLASLPGCHPAETPIATPPASVAVRRSGAEVQARVEPGAQIAPIGFVLDGVRGYIRATMEIEGTADNPEPFLHDALFLANGEGRLSIAIREPWPDHPRGRVSIRCEAGGEDSTVDYEPELWFGRPDVAIAIEDPIGPAGVKVSEGDDVVLARIVAESPGARPIRVTFKAAFSDRPIKPRVKAGVRPPR
ncbi:hypothetical protein TA3x_005284 [Tundrisphaera sp. TA3]|uniref:hypothetical protein n=1 Tax=Tundrisphaera sp. TA3 TaxID=3435775 RepID=UPI003EB87DD4